MDLLKTLQEFKPQTKTITLKTYVQNLGKLKREIDNLPIENLDFLKNKNKVDEFLEKYTNNSQRNYLNAIIVSLQANDMDQDLIDKYKKDRDDLAKEYREGKVVGKMNDKEKEGIITFETWDKLINKLEKQIVANKLKKSTDLDKGDFNILLRHLILTLYRKYPLRNDYHNVKIITRRESKKKLAKDMNYLVVSPTNMEFIISDYKTNKIYDDIEFGVDKATQKVIRRFLKKSKNTDFLLTDFNGKEFTSNRLTKFIQNTFNDLIGKKIGSSMLRKSYLSGKYGNTQKEMMKDAKMMGHTVKVAQEVYTKQDVE
jgi:hypothetical protein